MFWLLELEWLRLRRRPRPTSPR